MNKLLMLLMFGMLLIIPMVSADLGTYPQSSCVNLFVPLNATSVNLTSIQHLSTIENINSLMTQAGNGFNYIYCNTSDIGTYNYGFCDNLGNCYGNSFTINAQGVEYSTTQGLVYSVLFLLLMGTFVGLLYYGLAIDADNGRNEDREIIFINYKKYLKIFLLTFAYITFVMINFFAWNIASGILNFDSLGKFFEVLFWITSRSLYLVLPIMFYYSLRKWFKEDKPLLEELKRGIVDNE